MPRQFRVIWLGRILSSRLALLALLLLLAFLLFSFGREFTRNFSIQQEIAELEAEKADLEAKNMEISAFMDSIQTETFIEHEARIKLGLAKPGEKVVVLPDLVEPATASSENGNKTIISLPDLSAIANSRKWWYYFFDINKFEMIKFYGNGNDSLR